MSEWTNNSAFSDAQFEDLTKRLNPERIIVGENGPMRGVKYLEGHDVVFHANRIFGFGKWGYVITDPPKMVEAGKQGQNQTPYEVWAAGVRLTVDGCPPVEEYGVNVRQGTGSGGLRMAFQGCVTDGLKRCLKAYGDQFGLELRDTDLAPAYDDYRDDAPVAKAHAPAQQRPPSAVARNDGTAAPLFLNAAGKIDWPAFYKQSGIHTIAELKAVSGDDRAHQWSAEKLTAFYLRQRANEPDEPAPTAAPPPDGPWFETEPWGEQLYALMGQARVGINAFAPIFGREVTERNFADQVNAWQERTGRDVVGLMGDLAALRGGR